MLLRKKLDNPAVLIRIGCICGIAFFALRYAGLHPADRFWEGFVDGLSGVLLGAYGALLLLAARINSRQRPTC
jgi:hypothetical protein